MTKPNGKVSQKSIAGAMVRDFRKRFSDASKAYAKDPSKENLSALCMLSDHLGKWIERFIKCLDEPTPKPTENQPELSLEELERDFTQALEDIRYTRQVNTLRNHCAEKPGRIDPYEDPKDT